MNSNTPVLEIRLFGSPELIGNSSGIQGLRRKNRALVYYLAAQGQTVSRDRLLSFFWPDHERPAAQAILRTMVHDLRKALGEVFQADDQLIRLGAGTVVDVLDFQAALGSPDLDQLSKALRLYRGDFLEGFSLSDAAQFEDWAAAERDRLRLAAMHGFAELSHRQESLRDHPSALDSARRALAFDPFQEELQRDVMRLLYRNGDRAGVIRQYEALRRLLDDEMGIPPMPETRSLYDSILNEALPADPVERLVPTLPVSLPGERSLFPFLGREQEMASVKGQLAAGKLILLEGEAGIGKTRFLTELVAARLKEKPAALVLQGTSYELEQGLPYQPLVDALRKLLAHPDGETLVRQMDIEAVWLSELSRLLPELLSRFPFIPAPVQPADEARLWEALLRFFRSLARAQEVWLFLDDLHWADAATVAWLGYLVRHLSSESLVLLAASRPTEGQTGLLRLVHALKREDRLVEVQLAWLPETAMQEIAVRLSRQHPEQFSGWLIQNAEGNPFFLTELVRYAYEIGLLKEGGALDLGLLAKAPALPPTIQNLVESRLLKLSDNARRLLHAAAIIGRKFDFNLVRQALAFSEADTLDAIEELQAAQLIHPLPDDQFVFDHSLTMQVTLHDMNETRRRSLHRGVAEALESLSGEDPDPVAGLIAHHFLAGSQPERAKAWLLRAGRYAADLAAWVEAVAFYTQGLELERGEAERAAIRNALGNVHFHKGDFALASEDYRSAIQLARACRDWPLLEQAYLGMALSLYPQGRFTEAIEMARELRQAGPPEMALCAEFIWGASLGVESAHPRQAEQHLHHAEQLLQGQQGPARSQVTMVQIKYSLAGAYGQQGRSQEAVTQFLEVLAVLESGEDTLDTLRNIMLYNNLAYHLHLLAEDASAAGYIRKGIQLARERGSLSHLPYLYSTSGEIALAAGDLDAAEKHFSEGLELARQVHIRERIAGMTANLGLVARARGDERLACERLQEALALVEPLGNHHLEVRIRLWLAPLLPREEGRPCLASARRLAEQDGLDGLLEEIGKLEREL